MRAVNRANRAAPYWKSDISTVYVKDPVKALKSIPTCQAIISKPCIKTMQKWAAIAHTKAPLMWLMCSAKSLFEQDYLASHWSVHHDLVWPTPDATHGHAFCLVAKKEKNHPSQLAFPFAGASNCSAPDDALIALIINQHTKPGDTIVDPCATDDQILRIAIKFNRYAIGIAPDKEHGAIIVNRIAQRTLLSDEMD